MIGIYKITNKITSQSYIGQSVNIERRWSEHCRYSKSDKSLISKAISIYGKDNFIFEVLCECSIDELDKNESYYIHHYNTITPNGYNVESVICGNSRFSRQKDLDIQNIINDIKTSDLSLSEIAQKYKTSKSTITRINKGQTHYIDGESYPLRNTNHRKLIKPEREYLKQMIRIYSFCEIGRKLGVSESSIRDWCKTYNLPSTRTEISSFSEEEWNKV